MTDRFIVTSWIALCTLSGACGDDKSPSPPVIGDVTVTTAEDTPVPVTVALAAGDPAAVAMGVVTSPSHGILSGTGPTWTYTPAPNYTGDDLAVVLAADIQGTATATVHITVTAVDDAPIANPDSVSTAYGAVVTIAVATLLANDSDPEGSALGLTGVQAPVHGAVSLSGGDVVFVPDTGFIGLASFAYTISDGELSAQGTVTVLVGTDASQSPVAVGDTASVTEGSSANALDVLGNDSDVDGGARAVATVTQPAHGSVGIGANNASVTYTPAAGYCNQAPNTPPDTFTYTLAPGGSTATVTVSVACACGVHKATDFVVGSN
jgi:hypothetical protein